MSDLTTGKDSKHIATVALMIWSVLPSVAMWLGLYEMRSAVWAYVLYHGVVLLPAIIWGCHLWKDSMRLPTRKEWFVLFATSLLFSAVTVLGYELIGTTLLSDVKTIELMKRLGWYGQVFWPISIYGILVNPILEEVFWRGIIFNALDKLNVRFKHFALVWSSVLYAAFHYFIFRLVLFPVYAEIGTLGLVIYGVLMAFIYRQTGSILTTAVAHGLLTDMAALALMLDLFRRHPDLL
jgi:uncharacterized protein